MGQDSGGRGRAGMPEHAEPRESMYSMIDFDLQVPSTRVCYTWVPNFLIYKVWAVFLVRPERTWIVHKELSRARNKSHIQQIWPYL